MTKAEKMALAEQFARGGIYRTEKLNRYYTALVVLALTDSNIFT